MQTLLSFWVWQIWWRCILPLCGYKHQSLPLLRDLSLHQLPYNDASQKSDRYWTDGRNTSLSCTTTKPMEIHHYWTVPRETQRMTTPSFAEKWRLQYNHRSKGSQLESTTSQQNWDVITALTTICNKIRQTGEWPTPWTQSLLITLPKKGNLQQCQNYRTISLISHPSKVMLKITLNRLKPQAEKIIAEEQAGFRAGRSTTEQIFNLWILCEKYLQHQQDLYNVFIDFKRVWHAALWTTMKKYNISTNLIPIIKNLYNKATSAVLFNSNIGDWFQTRVGVWQGCLLPPTVFNVILEWIITDALEDHKGTVSIGGRTITNLCFADDMDGL